VYIQDIKSGGYFFVTIEQYFVSPFKLAWL